MDGFFGVGLPELFMIAVIALIVLGPERLPGTIREVAKFIKQVRLIGNDLMSQFGDEFKDLQDLDPRRILNEMTDPTKPDDTKKSTPAKPTTPTPAKNTTTTTTTTTSAKPATPATTTAVKSTTTTATSTTSTTPTAITATNATVNGSAKSTSPTVEEKPVVATDQTESHTGANGTANTKAQSENHATASMTAEVQNAILPPKAQTVEPLADEKEEKPKTIRKRTPKKNVADASPAESTAAELATDTETVAEEKSKPKRARKPAKTTVTESGNEESAS